MSKTDHIQFRIEPSVKKLLVKQAGHEGISLSAMLITAAIERVTHGLDTVTTNPKPTKLKAGAEPLEHWSKKKSKGPKNEAP